MRNEPPMQICTGTGPIRIGGKHMPNPAPAPNVPASYSTSVASLPISTPKIWVALPRNGNDRPQTPNVDLRSHSAGGVFALSYGEPFAPSLSTRSVPASAFSNGSLVESGSTG